MVERYNDDRNGARLAAGLVAYALDLTADGILSGERGNQDVSRGRQVAMYLAHVGLGMSLARVGYAFGRDRSTVAHGCQLVEEFRDDPEFDIWIERLETGLSVVAGLRDLAA